MDDGKWLFWVAWKCVFYSIDCLGPCVYQIHSIYPPSAFFLFSKKPSTQKWLILVPFTISSTTFNLLVLSLPSLLLISLSALLLPVTLSPFKLLSFFFPSLPSFADQYPNNWTIEFIYKLFSFPSLAYPPLLLGTARFFILFPRRRKGI